MSRIVDETIFRGNLKCPTNTCSSQRESKVLRYPFPSLWTTSIFDGSPGCQPLRLHLPDEGSCSPDRRLHRASGRNCNPLSDEDSCGIAGAAAVARPRLEEVSDQCALKNDSLASSRFIAASIDSKQPQD